MSAEKLAKTPLGEELGKAHCETIAGLMTIVDVTKDGALFQRDDEGDALYVVTRGSFNIVFQAASGEDLVVAVLGQGGIIGELEVLTGMQRMAAAVATESSSCLKLEGKLIRERPAQAAEALAHLLEIIARTLGLRLAAVNDKLLTAWNVQNDADQSNPADRVREALDNVWRIS
jgi:CRP-like cAMP-binding protein